jgi:hypothetical protein
MKHSDIRKVIIDALEARLVLTPFILTADLLCSKRVIFRLLPFT